MFHSIRWRIALLYVTLILVIMFGLGLYISNFVRQTYLSGLENQLGSQARMVAAAIGNKQSNALADPNQLDAKAKYWASILGARVTLIGPDGVVLGESHTDRTRMDNHLSRPEVAQALATGQGNSVRISSTTGFEMMYSAYAIRQNGQTVCIVRVALPLSQVEANTAHLQRVLLGASLLAAGLAILLAMLVAGQTTRPLRELTRAIAQLSVEELGKKPTLTSRDEVGQLALAFDAMRAKLSGEIAALNSERGKLSAVLQKMTDGVLIVDEAGFVQLINPAAEEMFNVTTAQACGRSLVEVLRHHQPVEMWQLCRATNKPQSATLEIGLKRLYLQGTAAPLGDALPGSTLLLFQNLTRQRQLETVRRDFISNISHELRTPLAALKALTETLQEGALEDPPAARRFLQQIETEVDALSLMTAELLELSRIESGRVPLELKPTPPLDIAQRAYERLRLQAERAGLTLQVACDETLPLVLADGVRLQQVAVNLLHNAIKFTPAGGKIEIGARQDNSMIVFYVKDNGIGISPEDLPRIFERFYKADRSRASSGTGLGLAIARHLVEAHNGRIWAESRPGEGSTFYFSVPIA